MCAMPRKVAFDLGMPFYVRDYTGKFEEEVVDYFTAEYLAGPHTPIPAQFATIKLNLHYWLN